MEVRAIIDQSRMTGVQYSTILICFLMNMLDGMDVLVISYTAPAIAEQWDISPQALGIVFSAGLMGMTLGAMFIAPKTDIIGRKPMILISAALMCTTIYLTGYAQTINELVFYRFISGLGIGSMLASTPALAAEYAPNRSKDFWVSFVLSGYPLGAFFSGMVAAKVIPLHGWPQVFKLAGIATAATIPLIYFFLAESLDFLLKKRPRNALARVNALLVRMKGETMQELPELFVARNQSGKLSSLFTAQFKSATLKLWVAFFMAFMSLYFLVSWIPKLAVNTGLSMELAIYAGTVFNLGSFVGINSQGYLSAQLGLRRVIGYFLIGSALLMVLFGMFEGSAIILVVFGLIGFLNQGGFVGLYSVAARIYPTEIRTTGIGWAIGAGRLGAIVGPLLGGLLIGAGVSMVTNFIIFAVPAVAAGWSAMVIKQSDLQQ
jgi:benzoate transport